MRTLLFRSAFIATACLSLNVTSTANATSRSATVTATPMRLTQQDRWLIDPQGRVVMLHGANMIELIGNAHHLGSGGHSTQWSDDTPRLMREAGFNGIRLIMFMSRITPQPGHVDEAYLDAVTRTVAAYSRQGIHVLIDLHQDEYSDTIGERGMPAWMTLTDGLKSDPKLDFPNRYFKDAAVQRAFDNFWANKPTVDGRGVQDVYIDMLAALGRRFAKNPAVFGIDLMNEPSTGSKCAQPDPKIADCPELEQQLLAPFYAKAGVAMRKAAPNTILFVEPFMLQGALGIPINTPMPGAKQQGLSYHNYGPFRPIREKVSEAALARAVAAPAAILNTEWGFSNDAADLASQAQDFDNRMIPWLAWTRGTFEALVNPKAATKPAPNRDAVLRAYARPYAAATAGTPIALTFDADKGSLDYRWSTKGPDGRDRYRLTTEIAMPAPSYPQGYTVTVEGGRVLSPPNARLLKVAASKAGSTVTVRAARTGDLPPLTGPKVVEGPGYSIDSMLGDLLKDPRAQAIIVKYLPTLGAADQLGLAPQIRLRAMQPYVPEMNDAVAAKIDAELKALPVQK